MKPTDFNKIPKVGGADEQLVRFMGIILILTIG